MLKKAIVFSLAIVVLLATQALAQDLDAKKQTSLGKYATAAQVLEMVQADPNAVTLVDIRPVAAYYYLGHPKMAFNVPYLFWTGKWDEEKKSYSFARNSKFPQAMSAKFKKDQKIMVLSKAGVRSAQAIEMLAAEGFTNLYNITDGFDAWLKLPDNLLTRKTDPERIYRKMQ